MIKTLTAAATAMLATAATAQTPPPSPPPPSAPMAGHHMMMMDDKVMTRDEMIAKAREHFAMMDKNKDGVLTQDEMGGMDDGKMGDGPMAGHDMAMRDMPPMPDANAAFDRMDTNKDGVLSRDEFAKGREVRIERRIVTKDDGMKGGGQRGTAMWPHMHQRGSRMFQMADTNNDGKVTLAEAEAMAAKHFDTMDANHDGKVTPEERKAGRPMMKMQRVEKTN